MQTFYDFPMQSPASVDSGSFLAVSNTTQSPDPHNIKIYTDDLSPQSHINHDDLFQTPDHQSLQQKHSKLFHEHQQPQYNLPMQYQPMQNPMVITDNNKQPNNQEIAILKKELQQKYKNYSEQEIDEIIHKFVNDYLQKVKQKEGGCDFSSDEDEGIENFEDQSRDSLSTNIDWNDKDQLERYCKKMKKIEETKDFRPSQYFGAIQVDHLEDGINDPRIDDLFLDCFGIKSKPKKRVAQPPKKYEQSADVKNSFHNSQHQPLKGSVAIPNSIQGSSNNVQNDQSCKIVVNVYNQFQIMNQDQTNGNPQRQIDNSKNSQQPQMEDDTSHILADKSNKATVGKCQVLHQESKKTHQQNVKSSQQDSLKKYMSPGEINKSKHSKKPSVLVDSENNEFNSCCFKTEDQRVQLQKPVVKSMAMSKNYQTQINSPISFGSGLYKGHNYNQSITSNNCFSSVNSNQSLSHQTSLGDLSQKALGMKVKHQSNMSLNKQAYKSILYKHQNPNFQSIVSSTSSIENKPKQMNKLSYLSAKQLPENQLKIIQDQNHNRINSNLTVQPPKPPQNMGLQVNAKTTRDSKEGVQIISQDFESVQYQSSEFSPKMSPQPTLLQLHSQISQFSSGSQNLKLHPGTLTMQHANSTFQPQNGRDIQTTDSIDFNKTLVQQSITSFKTLTQQAFESQTQREKAQKTLGRNQSQNYFKTSNTINSVQSFLMASTNDLQKDFNKNSLGNSGKVQYLQTEEVTSSPLAFAKQVTTELQTNSLNSARPQTSINNNFSVSTGMNQYMSGAQNLGKPPQMQKGFLSQTSSTKNLKLQSKNLTINTHQTAQASSRKYGPSHHQSSIQSELMSPQNIPQTTRNLKTAVNRQFTKPASSLSKERTSKPIEKAKIHKMSVQEPYDNTASSLERKKPSNNFYRTQKLTTSVNQDHNKSTQQHKNFERKPSNGRNTQQTGLQKGKSAAMINEYLKNQQSIQEVTQVGQGTQNKESFNRTIQRINKSLDKIKQIFMNGSSQQIPVHQPPQSTKNANSNGNEILNSISNYQSFIKKAKADKETSKTRNLNNNKSKNVVMMSGTGISLSKTGKASSSTATTLENQKKQSENFKKYLSGTQKQSHQQTHLS